MTSHVTEAELPVRIWQELQRAPLDKHHDWRTPVLATVDGHGLPQARTVVLRQADRTAQTLAFFTDATEILRRLSNGRLPAANIWTIGVHAVDGTWGLAGQALSNAELGDAAWA